jgi:hypothetical protein
MPLLSAEFKTNMAVKYEEAKIYARNAYKKATTRTPKEPKETDDSPKKSMTMKEAYFKRMEKGTLKDADTNPMDRMAAMRLVDAGLRDAVWKFRRPRRRSLVDVHAGGTPKKLRSFMRPIIKSERKMGIGTKQKTLRRGIRRWPISTAFFG